MTTSDITLEPIKRCRCLCCGYVWHSRDPSPCPACEERKKREAAKDGKARPS